MIRWSIAVVVVFLLVLIKFPVDANDYITDAVQALENAHVYVHPSIEGAGNETSSKLERALKSGDNLVLIMLPKEAATESDLYEVAKRLSSELDDRYILGLAIGRDVIGFAPMLPSGTDTDLMRRASSVSNDPITALITYAQNIHIWQSKNIMPTSVPTEKPTPLPQIDKEGTKSSLTPALTMLIAVGISIFGLLLAFAIVNRVIYGKRNPQKIKFNSPKEVKDILKIILDFRGRINDNELTDVLHQMCIDVEKYFNSASKDKQKDSRYFNKMLTDVTEVLKKYIDVQNNMRYYHSPLSEMSKGKESILDFSHYVLVLIRNGKAADMVEYTVNTNILKAQKYR